MKTFILPKIDVNVVKSFPLKGRFNDELSLLDFAIWSTIKYSYRKNDEGN